jgi:hypothetical protein
VTTECNAKSIEFEALGSRRVIATFDGARVSSDAGMVLLHDVDRRTQLLAGFAACFTDHRRPELITHTVAELLRQRVFGVCCGYEDLVDHTALRDDPLLAAIAGKKDALGHDRGGRDFGHPLASPSTLNRLELTLANANADSRYRKIVYDEGKVADFFVSAYIAAHGAQPPEEIVLDLDATDDPIHGAQEGRFFHGYYGNYCYLPLYVFAGSFLLCAKLRMCNNDASAGAVDEVMRIVAKLRSCWPTVRIVLRADSGFARDELMTWCEEHGVDYLFGLARNARLEAGIASDLEAARLASEQTQEAVRFYRELRYRTHKTWSCERRVVAKAEHIRDKSNPRFVVTSLSEERFDARSLYEDVYCARGDMENRIKEQQLDLFADRTSAHTMRANQLRLWFASVAYTLINLLRHFGLAGTALAHAQAGTIRLKLLKLGAVVRVSVRRVLLSLSEASPVREVFARIVRNLRQRLPPPT